MYVFGIDMPIMELMFIFMVVLMAGLIFLLTEIRKLKSLILIERSDIYRFEEDLKTLKPKEKEKHEAALEDFVNKSLERGISKSDIEMVLISKGWPKEMVDKYL